MNLTKDRSHDKRFVVYCAVKRQKALELSQLIYRLRDIKVIENIFWRNRRKYYVKS